MRLILIMLLMLPIFGCAAKKYQKTELATVEQVSCRRLGKNKAGNLFVCARVKWHKGRCVDKGRNHSWQFKHNKVK